MKNKESIMKRFVLAVFIMLLGGFGFAAEITPFYPMGPYPSNGVHPGELDFSFAAIGVTNRATFTCTGRELLLVHNAATSDATFSITSVTDEFGANGTVGGTVTSGNLSAFWFGDKAGWDSGSGVEIVSGTSGLTLAVAQCSQRFKPVASATDASRFPVSEVLGPYPYSLSAGLDVELSAAGYVGDGTFPVTGRELVLWHNTDSSAHDIRLTGRKTSKNRNLLMPNHSAYSLQAGGWGCWLLSKTLYWVDAYGHCRQTCDDASVEIGIAKIPVR
jgi:hypothetical protein